jgi:hypothetical protein
MPSIKTPGVQVTYTSLIIDNGDSPGFKIIPEDAPEHTVVCDTASRAWMEMLKKIKKRQTISVSGPEVHLFLSFSFSLSFFLSLSLSLSLISLYHALFSHSSFGVTLIDTIFFTLYSIVFFKDVRL